MFRMLAFREGTINNFASPIIKKIYHIIKALTVNVAVKLYWLHYKAMEEKAKT